MADAPQGTTSTTPAHTQAMLWRYFVDALPAILAPFFGIVAALGIIVLILEWQGADPDIAWEYLYEGTLETPAKRADLVAFWMPLAITSFGLVLTFNAGLWNIGVEGQMIFGAIGATWAVRGLTVEKPRFDDLSAPQTLLGFVAIAGLIWVGFYLLRMRSRREWRIGPLLLLIGLALLLAATYAGILWLQVVTQRAGVSVLIVAFVSAAAFGALWAMVAAALKTKGGVNEIFGGVALNFIAQTFNIYLVANGGPWQPSGSRATETARFPDVAQLAQFGDYRRLSLTPVYIALGAFLVVAFIMYISRWGLQLRAMGKNQKSAYLLGVRTERNILLSMALCGGMAGIGGAFRVLALDVNKLTATPSGGIGFLAILVVLLASFSALLTPVVSFAFAVLSKGGQQIESGFQFDYRLELDRSLVRVLQSTLVLMVVLAFGVRNRFFPPRSAQPIDDDAIDRT